jgi:hypothetical protein
VSKRVAAPIVAIILLLALAAPAAADSAEVERIQNIDSVVVVALPDDFPIGSISRAECDWVLRVERPDGSATEKLHCTLSDEPVMIPEFQGHAPDTAFHNAGGPCMWVSEWWFAHDESIVFASSFQYVVTPSGMVIASSTYPAEPLTCE